MIKSVFFGLLFTLTAHASMNDVHIVNFENHSQKDGINLLRQHLEESRFINRTNTFAFEEESKNHKNGDFVILWGVGSSTNDQEITEAEYKGLWRIMNYLSQKDFRVILNVKSTAEDLADAFQSKTSSVVVYSSHGNMSYFYDFNSEPIPTDIFKHRSKNVYQFILSACYGSIALRTNYVTPKDLLIYSWEGLTNPDELVNFLVSDNWTGLEGKK